MTGGIHSRPQTAPSQSSSGDKNNRNRPASILRSTSNSSAASSPRFTFDFIDDDASFSASTIKSQSSQQHLQHLQQEHSSPRHSTARLSPSRLDARYSSRLPPSYGNHGYSGSQYGGSQLLSSPNHRSYTTSANSSHGSEEIKRNLFGGSVNSSSNDGNNSSSAMDVSTDFMDVSSNNSINNSTNITPSNTPRSRRSNPSPRSSNRWTMGMLPPSSPANRTSSIASSSRPHSVVTTTTSTSNVPSTFLTSSPRKRGIVTGVSSPLSGNLSRAAAQQSALSPSVASGPANNGSVTTTPSSASNNGTNNGLSVDCYERNGAGDRFIPSRALSNFDFELPAGTGCGRNRGGSDGRRGNSSSSDANDGGAADGRTPLATAPSFGATMMGGAPAPDPPSAAARATGGGGSNAPAAGPDGRPTTVDPAFSDDAASADGRPERHDATNRQPLLYDALLRSELLGENVDPAMHSVQSPTGLVHGTNAAGGGVGNGGGGNGVVTPFRERSNNLRFSPNNHNGRQFYRGARERHSSIVNSFGLAPVSMGPNQRASLGSYTERCKRKIAKVPTKVLDAPALQDDFYLNLVDWSSQNVLAVGLGSCVYLWSAATSRVTQLCDLSSTEDAVTSVAWSEGGRHLAIGSTRGDVQLWDASATKLVRTMTGHSARVGALSWKLAGGGGACGSAPGHSSLLASGSRDRLIHLRDPRSDSAYEMRLCGHKQEVCGLKWSFDERSMLASGGNDNKLLVWDVKKHAQPFHTFADHTAAVKAIAWSPHQHGLLASGGGTADRCIRFWNCLTGQGINCIDTGSQVCNLAFSKNCNELVSTHGYSLNQIVVWKYPSMQKIATLTGHTYRVLYLALSPDGSTIVTGAGDETLRFWQVFPGPQKENKAGGLLFPAGMPGSVIR
eukprot:CAMPEP_0201682670 /NCGR_PEP_ID=MMETSP0494-20130426/51735_1 /ASSEMBLY_ACC=CAM_ASM_000839 /TAXON_ID=420259 /ORGANISM="Thalassiosira gravida, Strain GMp14c1" /LENGTH=897 /DNA_ID=CAMNT_0048166431 /DNA_START=132 /DNA_END=2825 /DNA_ORIENTATION=-